MQAAIEVVTPDTGRPFRAFSHRGNGFPRYWHRHPEYELLGIAAGAGEGRIGDRIDQLAPPQVMLLGPHLPHACTHAADYEHLVVQFRRDCLGEGFFDLSGSEAARAILDRAGGGLLVEGRAAAALLERMRELIAGRGLESVAAFLHCLAAFADADPRPLEAGGDAAEGDRRLQRVIAWVDRHAHEEIALDDAAGAADMHPKAFARWFRRASGHSFHGYLGHVRIGRACARLRDGDERITDIALAVGFGTLASFNRLFLRRQRMTPSAYRQRSHGA